MDFVEPDYNTAVAAMRLQSPYLHEGYLEILDQLVENHEKVIVMLGVTPVLNSTRNPLTFEQRRQMLQDYNPDIIVLKDVAVKDDEVWSKRLDKEILSILTPNDTVCLYGGRDSFIPSYSGRFPVREFASKSNINSTEVRRLAARRSLNSEAFRAGVVWASANRFPVCYPTVDVAILNEEGDEILLGRKEHESKFRLIGGFADPKSPSYEHDVYREATEETNLEIGDIKYVGSAIVPDWRYADEPDCIKTMVFTAKKLWGAERAQDDIAEIRWFKLDKIQIQRDIVDTHHGIMAMVLDHLGKIQ